MSIGQEGGGAKVTPSSLTPRNLKVYLIKRSQSIGTKFDRGKKRSGHTTSTRSSRASTSTASQKCVSRTLEMLVEEFSVDVFDLDITIKTMKALWATNRERYAHCKQL